MKNPFKTGDTKQYIKTVKADETATFETGAVHPFYATFALGRDAEWACRLFVLEMKEDDEEGIGTFLTINHHSPAMEGDEIKFIAEMLELNRNEIICGYTAYCGLRKIAEGKTGQKILKKEKLERLVSSITNG